MRTVLLFAIVDIIIFAFCMVPDTILAENVLYDSHGKRNPFVPPSRIKPITIPEGSDVDTSKLEDWFSRSLAGILWDQKFPYAMIEDQIVGVGEEVKGCTIVEIKPEGIVFQYKQKRVKIPLREGKDEH
jgi:hypothetical protein